MTILIPVLLNNSRANSFQYSLTTFDDPPQRHLIDVSSRELQKIEAFRKEQEGSRGSAFQAEEDPYLDLDLDDESLIDQRSPYIHMSLEKTQRLMHLRINRPGVIRLEKVVDAQNAEVRIRKTETTIVECPTARFLADSIPANQCIGATQELSLQVKGSLPMTLRWHRDVQGKREQFVVEGIDSPSHVSRVSLFCKTLR
jgi:nucleoporin POM152